MTWVDLVVLVVVACSALLAFLRGFVREALGICAWAGAGYVAWSLFDQAKPAARHYISNPEIADPVAFGVIFLVAVVAFSIVANLIARVVRLSALGGLDRTVGLLFGALRGALVLSVAYLAAGLLFAVPQWPDSVLGARSLPYVYEGARWIASELPSAYSPNVQAPPQATTHAGALLQSAPRGYAIRGRGQGEP